MRAQRGQATVEFILATTFLLSFLVFGFRLALIFSWSSYIQYATFMSARALLSGGADVQDQRTRAIETLKVMVKRGGRDRFDSLAQGRGGNVGEVPGMTILATKDPEAEGDSTWQVGVRYSFRSRLILVPGAPQSGGRAVNRSLDLTSESWLGREPTREECRSYLQGELASRLRGSASGRSVLPVVDNGC